MKASSLSRETRRPFAEVLSLCLPLWTFETYPIRHWSTYMVSSWDKRKRLSLGAFRESRLTSSTLVCLQSCTTAVSLQSRGSNAKVVVLEKLSLHLCGLAPLYTCFSSKDGWILSGMWSNWRKRTVCTWCLFSAPQAVRESVADFKLDVLSVDSAWMHMYSSVPVLSIAFHLAGKALAGLSVYQKPFLLNWRGTVAGLLWGVVRIGRYRPPTKEDNTSLLYTWAEEFPFPPGDLDEGV